MREEDATARLADWYSRHARALPWRVSPAMRAAGEVPDPYHVWLSEIMLQQTTVAAVLPYFEAFTRRWPTVRDLGSARDEDVMAAWAGLGYYARARNLLKCARAVSDQHAGRFPDTEEALLTLPGIGPYTAAAIAAIAFDRPATVVDGNVERVISRLHAVEKRLPAAKPELHALAARLTPDMNPGDHAQAMMDLGATICTPRNPACGICPLIDLCAGRKQGDPARYPLKTPKKAKPIRRGIAWAAFDRSGAVLLETRPDTGLLGGMLGLPGTAWAETAPRGLPPLAADWRAAGEVRHTFTHFHLVLTVHAAHAVTAPAPKGLHFHSRPDSDLPTVMRKAVRLARAE